MSLGDGAKLPGVTFCGGWSGGAAERNVKGAGVSGIRRPTVGGCDLKLKKKPKTNPNLSFKRLLLALGTKRMEIPSLFLRSGRNRCFFSWIKKGGGNNKKILPVGGKSYQLSCEFAAEM